MYNDVPYRQSRQLWKPKPRRPRRWCRASKSGSSASSRSGSGPSWPRPLSAVTSSSVSGLTEWHKSFSSTDFSLLIEKVRSYNWSIWCFGWPEFLFQNWEQRHSTVFKTFLSLLDNFRHLLKRSQLNSKSFQRIVLFHFLDVLDKFRLATAENWFNLSPRCHFFVSVLFIF